MFTATPSSGTLVEVAITYAELTLFNGTPLMAYGPVTKIFPASRCLRATTLLPLCFPDKRITTVPGVIDLRPVDAFGTFLFLLWRVFSSSAGYQVLSEFLYFLRGAPPKAKLDDGST